MSFLLRCLHPHEVQPDKFDIWGPWTISDLLCLIIQFPVSVEMVTEAQYGDFVDCAYDY